MATARKRSRCWPATALIGQRSDQQQHHPPDDGPATLELERQAIKRARTRTPARKTAWTVTRPSRWYRCEELARLAGFEPTTPWFVAKYSIQLSYSRRAAQYS